MDFSYNDIQIPECKFRISPSSIGKFFSLPKVWYDENILGKKEFIASTSTVLGTVVHAIAETYALGDKVNRDECDAYIDSQAELVEDIDTELIKTLYPQMAEALVNEYLKDNPPTEIEQAVWTEVKEGIYVGGTTDNRTGDTVIDYKNVSTKPSTEKVPFDYFIQMMAYAKAYRDSGIHISRLRLVYVVRPTKTLPVRVFVVNHQITPDDWVMIENTLNLIADTLIRLDEQPELAYLLFKSYALKET